MFIMTNLLLFFSCFRVSLLPGSLSMKQPIVFVVLGCLVAVFAELTQPNTRYGGAYNDGDNNVQPIAPGG